MQLADVALLGFQPYFKHQARLFQQNTSRLVLSTYAKIAIPRPPSDRGSDWRIGSAERQEPEYPHFQI
jgi:hypothetical protein